MADRQTGATAFPLEYLMASVERSGRTFRAGAKERLEAVVSSSKLTELGLIRSIEDELEPGPLWVRWHRDYRAPSKLRPDAFRIDLTPWGQFA